MKNEILEKLNIELGNPEKMVEQLNIYLAELDEKKSFCTDTGILAKLEEEYAEIEQIIEDIQANPSAYQKKETKKAGKMLLPQEDAGNLDTKILPQEDSEYEKTAPKQDTKKDAETIRKDLVKDAKKLIKEDQKKQAEKKKQDKDTSSIAPDVSTTQNGNATNGTLKQALSDMACGNYSSAINTLNNIVLTYDKKDPNQVGEASYYLATIYKMMGLSKKSNKDRFDFYLKKAADCGYPDGQFEYAMDIINLSNSVRFDVEILKYLEGVTKSNRAKDSLKKKAKENYVDACKKYAVNNRKCLIQASDFCKELASEESDLYLKQVWNDKAKDFLKFSKSRYAKSSGNRYTSSSTFVKVLRVILILFTLFCGNIGYVGQVKLGEKLKYNIPIFATAYRIVYEGEKTGPYLLLSPFLKSVSIINTEEDVTERIISPFFHGNLELETVYEGTYTVDKQYNSINLSLKGCEKIVIPDGTKSVTLRDMDDLREVELPADIVFLEVSNCSQLEELDVKSMGRQKTVVEHQIVNRITVENCENLKTISVPDNVDVFEIENINLTKLNVKAVKDSAFDRGFDLQPKGKNPSIEEIRIEDGCEIVYINNIDYVDRLIIGNDIGFAGVYASTINQIEIGNNVEAIEIWGNILTPSLSFPDGMKFLELSNGSESVLTQIELPPSIEQLELWQHPINSLVIPENVSTLTLGGMHQLTNLEILSQTEDVTIKNCEALSSVKLPEGKSLSDYDISNCPLLEE